ACVDASALGTVLSVAQDRRFSATSDDYYHSPPAIRPTVRSPLLPPPESAPHVDEKPAEISSAGTIMGLHNVFISSPQFISTLLASVIFRVLGAGGRGDDIHPAFSGGEGRAAMAVQLIGTTGG